MGQAFPLGFLSYLWGIETIYKKTASRGFRGIVFIVPMRDWNRVRARESFSSPHRFLSYLWGIETWSVSRLSVFLQNVFIVPMRDWNFWTRERDKQLLPFLSYLWGIETSLTFKTSTQWSFRFYRTYEGLKHVFLNDIAACTWVFIVPMRDWNSYYSMQCHNGIRWFLSYLWGIETEVTELVIDRYNEVFIVPMRDWNHVRIWFLHVLW